MQNLRFVAGPDGVVYYDPSGKAQGKSMEIPLEHMEESIVTTLQEQLQAKVPEGFINQIVQQSEKRFSRSLSLAKKTGALVVGSANVLEALRKNKIKKVLVAEDAGGDLKKKLAPYEAQCTCLMHTNVYDEALGGHNIVVVGLKNELKVQPLLKEVAILRYFYKDKS